MGSAESVLGFKWARKGDFYQEAVECYKRRATHVFQRTVVDSEKKKFFQQGWFRVEGGVSCSELRVLFAVTEKRRNHKRGRGQESS